MLQKINDTTRQLTADCWLARSPHLETLTSSSEPPPCTYAAHWTETAHEVWPAIGFYLYKNRPLFFSTWKAFVLLGIAVYPCTT